MLADLALALRRRDISARELVDAALRRIETSNPELNAVVLTCGERALEEAARHDAAVAAGQPTGPLGGIPVLIKDIEDVAGLPTTHGSLLNAAAAPAARDGLVPGRLRAAGGIVIGTTNVPEYAFEAYTSNRLFGPTHNPWGLHWSPGGSSGGSAAALTAGLAPVATATDGGGSIRIPASLCGLTGLKPTNGVIGRHPIPSWIDLSTDGPIGVSVADVELLLRICAGPVAGDPSALPAWDTGPARDAGRDWPERAICSPRTHDWGPLPASVAHAFEQALLAVESDLGIPVQHIDPADICPGGNPDLEWFTLCCAEQAYQLGPELLAERADDFDPVFLDYMRRGLATPIGEYLAVRRRRFDYVRDVDNLLGDSAVLITPTLVTEGFLADGRMTAAAAPGTDPAILNTVLQNITGHPAISLPAGVLPNGLPFALQITAPRFRDEMLLSIGRRWEQVRPWPLSAPGFTPFSLDNL